MPRIARRKSGTGLYHIMLRGINKQIIFEDDEDRIRFLKTLKKYKNICNYKIYGYCLMNNHVHLLIKEGDESISTSIKRISSSYVYWYNLKYERCGHLFQDRFKSEPVEQEHIFLKVLRYIHKNPIKAGVSRNVAESKWTSYQEYMGKTYLVDTNAAFYYLSNGLYKNQRSSIKDVYNGISQFEQFMNANDDDIFLDYNVSKRLSDDELCHKIQQLGICNINELQHFHKKERDEMLKKLKAIDGASIRQLSRVTGISKSVIGRVKLDKQPVPVSQRR